MVVGLLIAIPPYPSTASKSGQRCNYSVACIMSQILFYLLKQSTLGQCQSPGLVDDLMSSFAILIITRFGHIVALRVCVLRCTRWIVLIESWYLIQGTTSPNYDLYFSPFHLNHLCLPTLMYSFPMSNGLISYPSQILLFQHPQTKKAHIQTLRQACIF